MPKAKQDRVYFVARQSVTKDGSKSTDEQFEKLERFTATEGLREVGRGEEKDTSGGAPLAKRPGLLAAVEAVEAGEADVIAVAYFDRLVRSYKVQAEVAERVEKAGGRIVALDVGEVSNGTAATWLQAGFLGLVGEYHRRSTGERVKGAQARAIAEGRPIAPHLPLGMRRNPKTGVLEQDPERRELALEVVRRRLAGASIPQLRRYMISEGVKLSEQAIYRMLANRMLLGEIRWGEYVNERVCPPLVTPSQFRRMQEMVKPRGRQAKSDRLMARLGVLRCCYCDGAMVASSAQTRGGARRPLYRCSDGDCQGCGTIDAVEIERVAWEETVAEARRLRADHGVASMQAEVEAAERRLEEAQAAFDTAVEAFDGLNAASIRSKLARLQADIDAADAALEELRRTVQPFERLDITSEELSLAARRDLITTFLARIVVTPARRMGRQMMPVRERITITTRREALT